MRVTNQEDWNLEKRRRLRDYLIRTFILQAKYRDIDIPQEDIDYFEKEGYLTNRLSDLMLSYGIEE